MLFFMPVLVHSYLEKGLGRVAFLPDFLYFLKDLLDLMLDPESFLGYDFMDI